MMAGARLATMLVSFPLLRYCGKTCSVLFRSLGFSILFTFKIATTIHEILLSHISSIPGMFPDCDDGEDYQDCSQCN